MIYDRLLSNPSLLTGVVSSSSCVPQMFFGGDAAPVRGGGVIAGRLRAITRGGMTVRIENPSESGRRDSARRDWQDAEAETREMQCRYESDVGVQYVCGGDRGASLYRWYMQDVVEEARKRQSCYGSYPGLQCEGVP